MAAPQDNGKLLETIEEVAQLFSQQTLANMAGNLRKRGITNTMTLLNSLDADTQSDLARMVTVMHFAFEEYGRFSDMKRMRWDYPANVENILEWVENTKLSYFGRDPHPYVNKVKTKQRRMNEIAWGIAKTRYLKRKHPKPKPWFQSQLNKDLNAMYEQLSLGVMDTTIEEMKQQLLTRMQRQSTTKFF